MANKSPRFRHRRNEGFVCKHCGARVRPLVRGSSRNHCPGCLWSKHVDAVCGDRSAGCGGMMRPVAVVQDAGRGWLIVHRCTLCGKVSRNKSALNDPVQPDSFAAMLEVARHIEE